jgi:hypothetical protein
MNISEILSVMKRSNDFNVRPKKSNAKLPLVENGHILPDDVIKFYSLCDGIDCYIGDYDEDNGGFPIDILPAEKVVPSKKAINAGLCIDKVIEITSSWYVIADCGDGNYITIDFDKNRLGRCYESFEYTHGSIGDCKIVARSFTEFLEHLIKYDGGFFYWDENPNFSSYGDAFDDLQMK